MKKYLLPVLLFGLIALIFFSGEMIAQTEETQDFEYDFNIHTEEVTSQTLLPMQQFREEGLQIIRVDEKRIALMYENNVLLVNTEKKEAILNGESEELSRKPQLINNDLLIPFNLAREFLTPAEEEDEKVEERSEERMFVAPEYTEVPADAEELEVSIILSNPTDRAQRYTFNSGQKFDLELIDQNGRTVYHWSRGQMFTQAIEHLTLEPGEKEEWQVKIPVEGLSSGEYTLEAYLTDRERSQRAEEVKITIE